jgi:hypothetical protein
MSAVAYEELLRQGGDMAVRAASRFLMEDGPVYESLHRVATRLGEIGVPYAVCGGMSLAAHGFVRPTSDVDVLVSADGLKLLHERLEGRGYLPPFPGSKQLKDTENGTRIEFLVAGQYPGDGKPKPVSFPDPADPSVGVVFGGVRYLSLATLIELKLASGMTAPHRMKDLSDVVELIQRKSLPLDFADTLNPYVRDKYREMWANANAPRAPWEEPAS